MLVVLVAVAVPRPGSDIRRRRCRRRLVRRGWWRRRRRWRGRRRGRNWWRRRWRRGRRWGRGWWRRGRRRRRRWWRWWWRWRRRRSATRRRRARLTVGAAPERRLPPGSQPLCLRAAAAQHDRSAGAGSPGGMDGDPRRRPLSVRGSPGQLNGRFHRRLWGGLDHPTVRFERGTPEITRARSRGYEREREKQTSHRHSVSIATKGDGSSGRAALPGHADPVLALAFRAIEGVVRKPQQILTRIALAVLGHAEAGCRAERVPFHRGNGPP